ncbi:MAG: translation elongation factor Ts [Planctomycetota bacterium]
MTIDAKTVGELRARTGLPMMKCKEALLATQGDLEAAEAHLRKLGLKTAEKVKDRTLKEGLVFTRVEPGGAAAVALLCETDFVARSQDFVSFGKALVARLFDDAPGDRGAGDGLAGLAMPDGKSVKDALAGLIAKTKENTAVGAWARFRTREGYVAAYLHHNQKIATLVELAGPRLADVEVARRLGTELCMHVAFHAEVQALSRDELDPAWIAREEEIFLAQVQDKPEAQRASIAKGKLNKRIGEVVLLDQPFIKDEKKTVQRQVAEVAKEAGVPIEVRRFARISAGG